MNKLEALILLTILGLFLTFEANAKTIRVAVIDSGLRTDAFDKVKVCKTGHKDFTGYGIHDVHGHGTNVAGLVDKYAKGDYCLVILKFYHNEHARTNNLLNTIKAFHHATLIGVDIINYSGGGNEYSKMEKQTVVQALDKGIMIVAAAGNQGKDLKVKKYYPATYDKRIIVVANMNGTTLAPTSNRGLEIDKFEQGTNMEALGIQLTGTSQATAVHTGKMIWAMEVLK